MKKHIKPIVVSLIFVVILNVFYFAKLTIEQAPFFYKAPDSVDSIYGMYASEKYSDVLYFNTDGIIAPGEEDIKKVENILKTVPATKLDKTETYLRMFRLNRADFALSAEQKNIDGEEDTKNTMIASTIYLYTEGNVAYIVCEEFTGYDFLPLYKNVAIYEATDTRLINALSEHKNKGDNYVLMPEWRDHLTRSAICMEYIIPVIIEFAVAFIVFWFLFGIIPDKRGRLAKTNKTD